jgi:hypothetical protein
MPNLSSFEPPSGACLHGEYSLTVISKFSVVRASVQRGWLLLIAVQDHVNPVLVCQSPSWFFLRIKLMWLKEYYIFRSRVRKKWWQPAYSASYFLPHQLLEQCSHRLAYVFCFCFCFFALLWLMFATKYLYAFDVDNFE